MTEERRDEERQAGEHRTATFALPDLGEGLTDAEIVSWLVTAGDRISVDQPVAEVETAKATVEVPSPYGGTVTELHGAVGDVVPVGAPLITVDTRTAAGPSGTTNSSTGGTTQTTVPNTRDGSDPAGGNGAADKGAGSGAVLVGYGTGQGTRPSRRRVHGAGGPAESTATGGPPTTSTTPPASSVTRVISPLVRRLARENGIDVTALRGSGAGGLILRGDVEASLRASAAPEPADAPGTHRIPLRGAHRVMAERLARSRREIPEATVWVDADATGMLELRGELNEAAPDRPVGVLGLVARFALLGLARFPELNAHFDPARQEIVRHDAVHLGFAAQTPGGLVVPVVRDAHTLTTRDLSARLGERAEAARSGGLAPADLGGGTFTVNNYGVFGVDGSAAIINHPEAAILGVGRILRRPWVVGDDVVPRAVTELTLTFDHRVCDGAVAGGFLRWVADCVERPQLLLGDL
ncbi:dihydrolipoamide acetyltransferase family protein [Nocardiopsis metallicus]|uniref:Dihydrolipoamide acetyltransferase component of pyruvate dehydrogenase complex n=1 Tax=Nocardiopsis metallicus TaxID=179819 RepID=A0A840VZL2_9ACTN|nr:dihydrolipoamide acetyltransferase family protein [Nocardiopsis metallicus]MBB5489154.1 pyruvate dehydrogenase E2 component (dihydrolipoamide acetyltransferase) [Nocardiopsis metallicus]